MIAVAVPLAPLHVRFCRIWWVHGLAVAFAWGPETAMRVFVCDTIDSHRFVRARVLALTLSALALQLLALLASRGG